MGVTSPLVSIITAIFNGQETLEACHDSVMLQTCKDFEWLLADDRSTDNSYDMISSWSDPRIHIFQTSANTAGPAAPRNLALSRAKGAYIAILDQDDIWEPDNLERQLAFMERYPEIALLSSNLRLLGATGKQRRPGIRRPGLKFPTPGDVYRDNPFLSSAIIIRRSAVEAVGGFDEHPAVRGRDEWELAIRISLKYKTAFNGGFIAGAHRLHQNNLSREILSSRGMEYIRDKHDQHFPLGLVWDVRARDCYNIARDALRQGDRMLFKKQISKAASYRARYRWKGLFLKSKESFGQVLAKLRASR